MKEEMISYLNARIDWYRQEQARLKAASCGDEAAHAQIAVNVCNIFLATYQAMKYDLQATLQRFSSIANTWAESRRTAYAHQDEAKQFVEEIKLGCAMEIIRRARELEEAHD